MKEMVGGCCVCSDERGWPDNPLVYCDGNGCTVAVHQACYGIVTVPVGPWYCRKCENPDTKGKVKCELCPSKSGAVKRADNGGWAHVVCALYIPEVRFGNVTSMEPIVLRLIPQERYTKHCYICQEQGKPTRSSAGACMQCNKSGCRQQFHVTCAQSLGLLCEEAGNYLDNVKYCGYCQHHYSKLKKGGNVKTIPPYKPVSHDSQSSDSSGEKDGDTSPMAGGSGGGTPTQTKSKGPGRKSSHSNSSNKSTPSTSKTATITSQSMEASQEGPPETPPPTTRKHKSTDKNRKKQSPSRRASVAGESVAGGSKNNTPAPSPQHSTDDNKGKAGGSTPNSSKVTPPITSPPVVKTSESVAVISSVASAPVAATSVVTSPPSASATSVVKSPVSKPQHQETQSVITNTDAIETKQTKKRKAVAAAAAQAEYGPPPPATTPNEGNAANTAGWEGGHPSSDVLMEPTDKIIKKAKTESMDNAALASQLPPPPPPPPPPPAHSPAFQPSPARHLPSPMPGPSGVIPGSNIRSPSQMQGKSERDVPVSLVVSVPLASTSHGLNLSANAQIPLPPTSQEMAAPTHVFHQPMKQAAMEPPAPAHSPHGVAARGWGNLNVAYEMQLDTAKPGGSGMGAPKEIPGPIPPIAPVPIRNKKRAALTATVVSAPPPSIQTATQSLVNVRKTPHPTPPPVYQETIKDSPPGSPNSERPLKSKMEARMAMSCTAPHMLGNELNPTSMAAARLQEQLNAELAAHAAGGQGAEPPVPPPLINKAGSSVRGTGSGAQSLDQLLERQWEQGSQFLMEQAQHFDIASLLSCLHQLRTENVRLEEHVGNLLQRRDHLLAVNARLAIPLTAAEITSGMPEPQRCPRENGAAPLRPPQPPTSDRPHQLIMREVQQKPS